jgi:putative ABC transport system ATP-binding protein
LSLIELQGISRVYGCGPAAVHALRPSTLSVEEGTFVAIYGASGSGKSTMLNMLGLLDEPTSGDYLLEGRNVAKLTDAARSEIRCRKSALFSSPSTCSRISPFSKTSVCRCASPEPTAMR